MNEHTKKLKEIAEASNKVPHFNMWDIERLEEYVTALFTYSKFKKGETVYLASTPVITDKISWGWMGYKDKLVEGASGIVNNVDYWSKTFRYDIMFKFSDGSFSFNEDQLTKGWDK